MPYKNAQWAVLAMLPVIVLAFWPGYFGQLREVPPALHAHGITASVWLVLLALQLWSIHARRIALHRSAGLALFVIVPAFAGATLAAVQGGFVLFVARSDPFHAAYAARLGMIDLVALCTLVGLVRYALVNRRHARTHDSAMLATSFLVLPPILARLVPFTPGFGDMSFAGQTGFPLAFHFGAGLAVLAALGLYLADRRAGAFLIVALSITVQSLLFETAGGSLWWATFAARAAAFPTPLLVSIGVVLAAIALWQGWARVPDRRPFGDAAVLGAS